MNNVALVGRLTKDIELRKTQSSKSVASYSIAIDRDYKKEGENNADFPSIVSYGQQADFLSKYAKKGAILGITGRILTRNYANNNGQKVYVTEVVSDSVRIIHQERKKEEEPVQSYEEPPVPELPPEPEYRHEKDLFSVSTDDLPFY